MTQFAIPTNVTIYPSNGAPELTPAERAVTLPCLPGCDDDHRPGKPSECHVPHLIGSAAQQYTDATLLVTALATTQGAFRYAEILIEEENGVMSDLRSLNPEDGRVLAALVERAAADAERGTVGAVGEVPQHDGPMYLLVVRSVSGGLVELVEAGAHPDTARFLAVDQARDLVALLTEAAEVAERVASGLPGEHRAGRAAGATRHQRGHPAPSVRPGRCRLPAQPRRRRHRGRPGRPLRGRVPSDRPHDPARVGAPPAVAARGHHRGRGQADLTVPVAHRPGRCFI